MIINLFCCLGEVEQMAAYVLVGVIMIKYENIRASLSKMHASDRRFFLKC